MLLAGRAARGAGAPSVAHLSIAPQISSNSTEEQLRTLFAPYGNVVEVHLLKKGMGSGCGFVTYDRWAACEAAIEALHGKTQLEGAKMPIVVKFADAKVRVGEGDGRCTRHTTRAATAPRRSSARLAGPRKAWRALLLAQVPLQQDNGFGGAKRPGYDSAAVLNAAAMAGAMAAKKGYGGGMGGPPFPYPMGGYPMPGLGGHPMGGMPYGMGMMGGMVRARGGVRRALVLGGSALGLLRRRGGRPDARRVAAALATSLLGAGRHGHDGRHGHAAPGHAAPGHARRRGRRGGPGRAQASGRGQPGHAGV